MGLAPPSPPPALIQNIVPSDATLAKINFSTKFPTKFSINQEFNNGTGLMYPELNEVNKLCHRKTKLKSGDPLKIISKNDG